MSEAALRWTAGFGVAAALGLLLAFDPFGPRATLVADDLLTLAAPLLAGALCWRAGARAGAHRVAWRLVAASAFAWGAGQAAWTFYELALGVEVPFPSLADAGYLAAIPLAAAGMLLLTRPTARLATRLRALLDGGIIASALLFASWAFALGPVARASEGSAVSQVIALAYPVGDVLVLSVAVYAASRAPAEARLPIRLAAAGLGLIAVADSGFAYLTATGAYQTGALIDLGWFVGYLLLAEAGLSVRAPRKEPAPSERIGLVEAVLPYGPAAVAGAVAAYVRATEGRLDDPMFGMAAALVALVIARHVVTAVDNVDLNRRLRRANEDLRRAESFRSQLLRNVSHDLTTAIAPLQHHVRKLGHDEVAERQLQQLLRLTQDVRDASDLEGGGLSLKPTRVDLVGLVRSAVDSYRAMAHERGLLLETRLPAYLPVRADAHRLTQVLSHMLTLAIGATPPGGGVLVEVGMSRGHARVAATHDGGRAGPEDLFEPFGEDGAGLGLYISRGIMEQHGGAMERAADGATTTLALTLPLESFLLRA